MFVLTKTLGCVSYGVAAIIYLADSILWIGHFALRTAGDKFISDGDSLTGWRITENGQ